MKYRDFYIRDFYILVCGLLIVLGCESPAEPDGDATANRAGTTVSEDTSDTAAPETAASADASNGDASTAEENAEESTPAALGAELASEEETVELDATLADAEASEQTPDEQFAAIKGAYDDAYSAFMDAYQEAPDADAKRAAMALLPNPDDYAGRMLALADRHPNSEAAVDALVWTSINTRRSGDSSATKRLLESYATNPKVAPVVMMMGYSPSEESKQLLRGQLDNECRQVQAAARYALGSMLAKQSDTTEEALSLLQSVIDDFADVSVSFGRRAMQLAPMAAGEVNEATKLQIGMVAPDIEGEDLDGVAFKLSDYRGKVVVVDFWGNW